MEKFHSLFAFVLTLFEENVGQFLAISKRLVAFGVHQLKHAENDQTGFVPAVVRVGAQNIEETVNGGGKVAALGKPDAVVESGIQIRFLGQRICTEIEHGFDQRAQFFSILVLTTGGKLTEEPICFLELTLN